MSSSEDSDAGPKRKRKDRRLNDSSGSATSGSPIIGNSSFIRQRRRLQEVRFSASDSDSSPILTNHRRKIMKVDSDSDKESDSSEIGRQRRSINPKRLQSDSDSDFSTESDFSDQEDRQVKNGNHTIKTNSESEFSDGESEKCSICLVSFKNQEVGTPESCDHMFCLECLQEWSKNVNTCPIDRQEYSLILVRSNANDKVSRQIPIERPVPQNEVDIFEDPTFCEICGSNDHEDRMLLCDGCDLGFHLYCLNPPLSDVPVGSWFCELCNPIRANNSYEYDLRILFHDSTGLDTSVELRNSRSTRIIPRTRHTERVRRRIANNRRQNTSENPTTVSSSTTRTRSSKKRRKKESQYKTVYEIDPVTGLTEAVQRRVKGKNRRQNRVPVPPKTVKKRLAKQLGMCGHQNASDVKVVDRRPGTASGTINSIRHSAGIPTLHLFGQNNDLDYFTDEEESFGSGSQILIRRAPNRSDVNAMRRTLRQKNVVMPEVVSSSSDLLDSILTSQEQLYSRNASYSIDSTGKFKIDSKIDLNKERAKAKETPYYNPNRRYSNNNQNYNRPYQNRYQRQSGGYYHSNNSFYNNEPSSSMNYSNYGNDDNDYPQDYSNRTLSGNTEDEKEEEERNNQNEESELDIYSDIETVTTTNKTEESDYRPLSPPPMPTLPLLGFEEDNNDSEPDMVIDDEKVQEETAVTSTVSFEPEEKTRPKVTDKIQSETIQSSSLENIKTYDYYNDDSLDGCPNTNIYSKQTDKAENDIDSDDECPNFSIYSKESKTMAIHTDISTIHQIGEVSSSPNFKPVEEKSQDQLYDPEETFNEPEETSNGPDQIEESKETEPDNCISTDKTLATDVKKILDQTYDPYDCERTDETLAADAEKTLDQTYDPYDCERSDETLATNAEKTLDQTYDPYDCERTDETLATNAEKTLDQTYDPYDCERTDETLTIADAEKTLDQTYDPYDCVSKETDTTYDPDNCLRTDETLATDAEKTLDQTYDPENAFEENSNSSDKNIDMEKEIYNFKEDRYDPAVPFSDDKTEDKTEDKPEDKTEDKIEDKTEDKVKTERRVKKSSNLLYSDSEDDENVVKKDAISFAVTDINNMTEDISEEERSYTPCLDEKSQKQGLEGLDTEMISDEERNDFDEGQDLKTTTSDGDALEINAKESELDLARPEDYEEGEIVDKNKDRESLNEESDKSNRETSPIEEISQEKIAEIEKGGNKENEESNKDSSSFKKISKSTKDRNYRDKERRPSRRRSNERENKKEKKKEKRKELERYNVRAIIAEKPRPLIAKDQFGRDIRNTPSRSRSRSYTPPLRNDSRPPVRSPSKNRRTVSRSPRRRSLSKDRSRKRRKSRNYRSHSRSKSPVKKGQKNKKRKRSTSRYSRKRKIDDKPKNKRRPRSRRRSRSPSPSRRKRTERERIDWSPHSQPQVSPSWTPPRLIDNQQLLRTESLTVTVNNNKKKKEKKKKDRRNKETLDSRPKKRRHERERTPPPSKEVFASGDNILVSVSFNNENEKRDVTTRDKRKTDDAASKKRKKRKNKRDLTGVKPVAIIDLERSPFRELTPSPKQIIVLTDSDNEDGNVQADSSQQAASPERGIGPKTPPEPQVKFSLAPKPPQIRAINNPLIDPDDIENNVENDVGSRISPGHKGPSTPLEPPNSPPSSPDAYDPFEPTKSRSPTPDLQVQSNQDGPESIDSRAAIDLLEKSINPVAENSKSLTPPLADIQPADSQSSVQIVTPDSNVDKSPTQIQNLQQISKPVAQTIPFSSVPTVLNTSTPLTPSLPPNRINILNATLITPPVASPIPQRIVLPNIIKSNSIKIPPTKPTPIKPMPAKTNKFVTRKRTQNGSSDDNIMLDFDSPYSPGSSDYEDLFEPPSEIVTKPIIKGKTNTAKSNMKPVSAFDALFGSPGYNTKPKKKYTKRSGKTKTVGVKLDEDHLKILDDVPSSAVEMQVKDKFLKKLNRQERVVEEVKLVLKPHYNKKRINKEEYKDIMRRSVPKICHNKSGEINPTKIKNLIEAYVRKVRHSKKVTSSSNSVNPQKM